MIHRQQRFKLAHRFHFELRFKTKTNITSHKISTTYMFYNEVAI